MCRRKFGIVSAVLMRVMQVSIVLFWVQIISICEAIIIAETAVISICSNVVLILRSRFCAGRILTIVVLRMSAIVVRSIHVSCSIEWFQKKLVEKTSKMETNLN